MRLPAYAVCIVFLVCSLCAVLVFRASDERPMLIDEVVLIDSTETPHPAAPAAPTGVRTLTPVDESTPEATAEAAKPKAQPSVALRGRVLGPAGPIAGANVTVEAADPSVSPVETTSAANGSFAAPVDELGRQVRVRVAHSDHVSHTLLHTVLQPADADLGDVRLTAGAVVRGRVVDADQIAATGVLVVALAADGTPLPEVQPTRTDARGAFEWRSMPATDVRVEARPVGAPSVRSLAFQTAPGQVAGELLLSLAPSGEVAGVVMSSDGRPIEGAQIELRDAFAAGVEISDDVRDLPTTVADPAAFTDRDGRFVIRGVAHVDQLLRASAPGYVPSEEISTAPDGPSLQITLAPMAGWGGRVIDRTTGDPIETFELSVIDKAGSVRADVEVEYGPSSSPPSSLLTEAGTFVLRAPPTQPFYLRIHADGFSLVHLGPFDAEVRTRGWPRFLLTRGASIQGHVTLRGESVRDAIVSIVAAPELQDDLVRMRTFRRLPDAGAKRAETDRDGHFEITGVEPGRYQVSAVSSDGARAPITHVVVGDAESRRLDLALQTPGRIEGVVYSGASTRAEVTVCLLEDGERRATTTSNSEGRYAFADVDPGEYALSASQHSTSSLSFSADPSVNQAIARVFVTGDATVVHDLILPPPAEVRGVVTSGGEPRAEAIVMISPLGVSAAMFGRREVRTDDRGAFSAQGLAAGRYEVIARSAADGMSERREVELTGGAVAQLRFDLGTLALTGRVLDPASGQPVAGMTVRCFAGEDPRSPEQDPATAATVSAQTDAQGRFVLSGLRPGVWNVSAEGSGHVVMPPVPVELPRAGALDLQAQPSTELSVLCIDMDSGAAMGLVRAELDDGLGGRYPSISDTKGEMYFPAISRGRFTLRTVEPDLKGEVELTIEGATHRALLPITTRPPSDSHARSAGPDPQNLLSNR